MIEAKDNTHAIGDGMQQALDYAETLQVPFVFSSTVTGSYSMTGPALALKKKPRSTTIPSHRRNTCGHAIVRGKA